MYFTYVLRSLRNGDLYVGSTEDIDARVKLHNNGRVRSTKAYRPWILLEKKEFGSRSQAVQHERFLKNHQQKEIIKKRHNMAA